MPTVNVDTINELELEEERGVITSVTRNCLVEFGFNEMSAFREDTSILRLALLALDDEGLTDGSHIGDPEDPTNQYHALYLTKRNPKLVADNQKVNVRLRYEHVLAGHNQLIGPAGAITGTELSVIYGSGRCSIVDKSTNFYFVEGDETHPSGRQLIQVAHTYPPSATGLPAAAISNTVLPRTVIQGGEISIPYPQANTGFKGLVPTATPYLLARRIIRHINTIPWNGEAALSWICSEVSYELNGFKRGPGGIPIPLYKMGFEFQFNSDTWEPFVIFHDAQFNGPPAYPAPYDVKIADVADIDGVVRLSVNPVTLVQQPAGAWNVPALPRRDFTEFFGAILDGMPF